ncbi:GNAT family N-acetyltransferase [Hyphococcus sp.]|uniref:GNAT family N-acetyltransferase n=1 Tax=Hyphococcus sp. TaxID=2038636 RepID=UPI0035C75DFE
MDGARRDCAIRAAERGDADLIADILAEAFAGDPVMNWTFGGAGAFRTVFRELARGVYLKDGFGHLAGGSSGDWAATLWLPKGVEIKLPMANELRIAAAALLHHGPASIRRAQKTAAVLARHHPHEPHYYLFAVGVRNSAQGNGLGGRLIREGLKRAEKDGAPAYLENSNPKNTPLYERLGFEVIAPLPLPDGAPPLLAMMRPAQPGLAGGAS